MPDLAVELATVLRRGGLTVPYPDVDHEAGPEADPGGSRCSSGRRCPGHPMLAWAESGLMWLTGPPDGPPTGPEAPVLGRVQAAVDLLARVSADLGRLVRADAAELLAGRSALLGLRRGGTVSANGSCRLLPAADGWVAINLARPEDVDAVGALLGAHPAELAPAAGWSSSVGADSPAGSSPSGGTAGSTGLADPRDPLGSAWAALTSSVPGRPAEDLVEAARPLGIPAARLPDPDAAAAPCPVRVGHRGLAALGPATGRGPLRVVDLSSMWAGPLAAHLLGRMGMRVVKVESVGRPDGARRGDPRFFSWLHAGHESVVLDFATPGGRQELHRLVADADIVIEASRPRALAQLGLDAPGLIDARPGRIWLSITGYGRDVVPADSPHPVAFGDDAAVAGGLVAWDRRDPAAPVPVFCGDAIADPLTGLFGALAVALAVRAGGGCLLDVAMRNVAGHLAGPGRPSEGWSVSGSEEAGWTVHQAGRSAPVRRPRLPARARP